MASRKVLEVVQDGSAHEVSFEDGRFHLPGGADKLTRLQAVLFHDDQAQPLCLLPTLPEDSKVELKSDGEELEFRLDVRALVANRQAYVRFQGEIHVESSGLLFTDWQVANSRSGGLVFLDPVLFADRFSPSELVNQSASWTRSGAIITDNLGFNVIASPRDTPLLLRFEQLPGAPIPIRLVLVRGAHFAARSGSFSWGGRSQPLGQLPADDLFLTQYLPISKPEHLDQFAGRVSWELRLTAFPGPLGAKMWNLLVTEPYVGALETAQDGQPVSLVPSWEPSSVKASWALHWMVTESGEKRNAQKLRDQDFKFYGLPEAPSGEEAADDVVVVQAHGLHVWQAGQGEASFPGFRRHDHKALAAHFTLRSVLVDDPLHPSVEEAIQLETTPGFGLKALEVPNQGEVPELQLVRIGALDLGFRPLPPRPKEVDADRLFRVWADFGEARLGDEPLPRICLEANLGVGRIDAGGQDDLPGEEFVATGRACAFARDTSDLDREARIEAKFHRERPVIVPLGDAPEGDFVLHASEQTADGFSQTLSLRLREVDGGQTPAEDAKRRLIVLDRHPFLIALVEYPPLRGQAAGEGILEIGNWSGAAADGASWELAGNTDGFTLLLPPQTVGEEMEKGRGYGTPGVSGSIEEGKPIDFRFSPAARFTLLPSFFRQRFAEAPWNLRRILGWPGQRAPGAEIVDLRFELLYGLTTRVTTPYLRLAELSSRLGAVPGRLPARPPWRAKEALQEDPDHEGDKGLQTFLEVREKWAGTYRLYLSRLGVLEPWDPHQPAELVLEDGVGYRLRDTAKLAYPIPGVNVDNLPAPLDKPHKKDGLQGGVSWGFFSKKIYDRLWENRDSVAGELARPYFSALGGWGYQKATFDRGLTTIYSDTAQGRVFFYSVERIGRIGVLWNRAKHVVVYERTVAPSDQFNEEQPGHLGRPVLRKVREYVEILEPERSYPEGEAPPVTRGFVLGSEFKDAVIPVNSRWGEDFEEGREEGWKVPLWREGLGEPETLEDSEVSKDTEVDVYPKPQILLRVAADPETGAESVLCEIDEPQKLYFYTRTTEGADDRTDLWPSIRNLDYCDRPRPKPAPVPRFDPTDPDRKLPDPGAVEPGFDAFTWGVVPPPQLVDLVKERTDEHLGAALRNVTMMRSQVREVEGEAETSSRKVARELNQLPDKVREVAGELLKVVPGDLAGTTLDEVKRRATKRLERLGVGKVRDELEKILEQAENLDLGGDPCAVLGDEVRARINTWHDRIRRQAESELWNPLREDLLTFLRTADQLDDALRRRVRAEVDGAFERFRGLTRPLRTGLETFEDGVRELRGLVRQLNGRFVGTLDEADRRLEEVGQLSLEEARQRLLGQLRSVRARLTGLLNEADGKLSTIQQGRLGQVAEQVRAYLRDFRSKLEKRLAQAEKDIVDAQGSVAQIQTKYRDAISELRELLSLVKDDKTLFQFIEDILTELTTTAHDTAEVLSGWPEDLRKALHRVITDAGDVDLLIKSMEAVVRDLDALVVGGDKALRLLVADVRDQAVAHVQTVCDQVLQSLSDLVAQVRREALGILSSLQQRIDDLDEGTLGDLRRELQELGEQVSDFAQKAGDAFSNAANGALSQVGDATLRLFRAFGDAPKVPGLDFNRERLAYFFDELAKAVDMTPVTALLDRIGSELKALSIRVPSSKLLDRVLPDALDSIDLSKILPDFAGLKLDGLFSGLKLPKLANDNVKVTHGVDTQSRRAWARAEVDVPMAGGTVFVFGPLEMRLDKARFQATARIEAGLSGSPRREVEGKLTGTWSLRFGGTELVRFVDTALEFDKDGRLHFRLDPKKVEMAAALKFLTDLIDRMKIEEGGFVVRVLRDGALPVGAESTLDLPLPDVTFGAFSITDLRLMSYFRLLAVPEFEIGAGVSLAKKEAPFALTVYIFSGGGWLDANARYLPTKKTDRLEAHVSIGISAGGGIAFRFGPVKGGVSLLFGIFVEFHSTSNSGLTVGIMILLRGEVNVASIVTANLSLLLEATYQGGNGSIVAQGRLKIEIKICWCFTLKVSTSVRYVLQGNGGEREAAAARQEALAAGPQALQEDPFDKAAQRYIGMFE